MNRKKVAVPKWKTLIYRYFGVNLTQKEWLKYLETADFWADISSLSQGSGLISRASYFLLHGLWQAKNGIVRPLIPPRLNLLYYRLRYPRFSGIVRFVVGIDNFFYIVSSDLKLFLKRKKNEPSNAP